jgi:hypothetical protein
MKNILVTHRSSIENMRKIQSSMLLKANYTSKNKFRQMLEDKNKVVWVSKGKSNWWNRINSGMYTAEASVTFEIEKSLVRKPNGIIKRLFGKSQLVIDGDVVLPLDAKFFFKKEY